MKRESWNIRNSLKTRPSQVTLEELASEIGFFIVKLAQASNNSHRQDVT